MGYVEVDRKNNVDVCASVQNAIRFDAAFM